ncbi:MAG: SH3 domain-containing protein [Clostridia bacterium]|nr:SH3 domain-containing protein [Clostridia bacterium]
MNIRQFKRIGMLLICAAMLFASALPARAAVIASGTTVSGTVRVYLSSIASNTSVDLTIDGSYSIAGDTGRAIARGTKVNIKNSGGTLLLTMNGQTQTMGSRFKLRRHQTSGVNGVYIAQARKPQSLYPGDIELIAKGGNIQIIVHVYMEDYMRGVLPYEMDNSFPLEALKAQAVAARTYALKKMSAQSSTYDLVDTTSDQVYNGTPTANDRCEQAVSETAGVVGTVGGEYMASYYTASNGGQTESVKNAWGSGSYSYLQIKDDPYDLRNSASIAKSVTFYHDGTTSVSALTQLLREEAAALLGAGSVSIEAITSVKPHTPKYGGDSRVYSKVDVGLRVAGYGSVTVTLDYFGQMESLCGMSINVLKNETLSVTETVGGYRLTARRYGHGVGMSQRGAQQMAKEGLSYDQILDFYFPGITLTKYSMTRTILPSMDGTQGGYDEIIADAKAAIVTLSNPLDSLNLRAQANTTSSVLATMAHGTQVTLLEMGSAWSRVQYGTLSGYVKNEFISVQEDEADETPSVSGSVGTATVALADESQTLNLRASPTINSAVLSHLRHGQVLTVLKRYESWTYVQLGQLSGYVKNDYIIYDEEGTLTQPQPVPEGEARVAIVLPSDGLNLREKASLTSSVVMTLPQGAMLDVTTSEAGGMIGVSLGGIEGFVSAQYVYLIDKSALNTAPQATPQPTPQPTEEPAPQLKTASVSAFSGLKLRAAPDTSAQTLRTMPYGTRVSVTGEMVNGFYPVTCGGESGYASAQYLILDGAAQQPAWTPQPTAVPTAAPTPTPVPPPSQVVSGKAATVTAASGLNMRTQPWSDAQVIAVLAYGVEVTITGEAQNGFYPVRVGTLSGYVSAGYLAVGQTIMQPTASPQPTTAPAANGYRVVVDSENGLNLRVHPNTYADVAYVLPYGMVLEVLGESDNNFLYVRWDNYTGYVAKQYVTPLGNQ